MPRAPRAKRNRARAKAAVAPVPPAVEVEMAEDSQKVDDNVSDHVEEIGGGDEEAEVAEVNSDEDAQYEIEDAFFEPLVLDMVRDDDDAACAQDIEQFDDQSEAMCDLEMGQGDATDEGMEMEPDPPVPEERNDEVQEEPEEVHAEVTDETAADEVTPVEQAQANENADNVEFVDETDKDGEPETIPDEAAEVPEVDNGSVPEVQSSESDLTIKKEDAIEELSSEQQSENTFEYAVVNEEGVKTEDDASVKEESDGDEEGMVVITDLRDLCPSLPIPSGKRILESTRDIIQQAVQELIEKFLDDSENVYTSGPKPALEQEPSSELLSRTFGCALCDISISHPGRFEIHSNSRKHLHYLRWFNGINLNRESGPFYCGVCRVSLPGRDVMASHLKSDRHVSLSKLFNVDRQYANYVMDRITGNGKVQISKSLQGSPYTTPEEGKPDQDLNAADRSRDQHKPSHAQDGSQGSSRTSKSDAPVSQQQSHKSSGSGDSAPPGKKNFVCELCHVTVQRESAMEEHLKGKRHRQKVRMQQAGTLPTPTKPSRNDPVSQDAVSHKDQQQLEESHYAAETNIFASDTYEEQWPSEQQSLAQEQVEKSCVPSSGGAEITDVIQEEDADIVQAEGEAGEGAEAVSGEEAIEATCDEEFGSAEEEGVNVTEGGTTEVEAANEESQMASGQDQEMCDATAEESQKKSAETSDEGKHHEESSKGEHKRDSSRHGTSRDSHRHSGSSSKKESERDSGRRSREDQRSRDAKGKEAGTKEGRSSRRDDFRAEGRRRPSRERKDSTRSDSKGEELKSGTREVRGARDRKRSASGSDSRGVQGSRDFRTRDFRGPVRRRSSLTRRDGDPPRRRVSVSPERPLASKKPKYSCLTCKVAIFSDRDYKEHFDSRRHRLEVERREKRDEERSRRRSPSPRTYRRRDRSRSPVEHRITAPLVIPSHAAHAQAHDPSSFLQAQWLAPFAPMQQHLQQLPQQQHIPHNLQQQAQQQLGVTSLSQASALPLESYTERRPIVTGTLDNMLLLQQQLLSLAGAGRNTATTGTLPMQQDYQNGLHQANPTMPTMQSQQEKQMQQCQQYKGATSFNQPPKPMPQQQQQQQPQSQFLDKSGSGRGQMLPDYKAPTGIHFRSSTADGTASSYGPQKSNAANMVPHVTPARENYNEMFQQATTNPSSRYGNLLDAGKKRPNMQPTMLQRRQQPQYGMKSTDVNTGYQFMQKRY